MKKLILLAAFALSAASASAQILPNFGLKAGVNIAKLRTSGANSASSENLTNFKVGGYADFGLPGGFSIQPGVELNGKGGKNSFVINGNNNYQEKANLLYVEIPINILYHIPVGVGKIYLGGGPYAAFGIAGKIKTVGRFAGANVDSENDVKFGTEVGDNFKNTDFGLNFLGGLQFKSGLNLGINYGLGLLDIAPNNNDNKIKTNNRLVGITVGYFF